MKHLLKHITTALIVVTAVTFFAESAVQLPILNWPGKRSDWVNVKTDVTPAAVGNGTTDDAAALQAGLNMIDNSTTKKVLYLPPGTYRITQTLNHKQKLDDAVWVTGHGRSTVILWDGATGNNVDMMLGDLHYSLIEGIVFDGNNKAGNGLHYGNTTWFGTENDNRHLGFKNLRNVGLWLGNGGQATAETGIKNCLFENCKTGAFTQTFNCYDLVFMGCEFYSCSTGVLIGGGSNTYIRDCHFENGIGNDISGAGPEHGCTIRRCTSLNSNRFVSWVGGVATLLVENCHVSGWKASRAMDVSGPPIVVFDCIFTNPPGTGSIPIYSSGQLATSCNSSVGTTNVLAPTTNFTNIPAGRRSGPVQSASQSFFKQTVNVPQRVFDVKSFGAVGNGTTDDRVAIQTAIDSARNYGNDAIVYLPCGNYKITSSLLIYGSNYRFGGIGNNSAINWQGAATGYAIRVVSPKNIMLHNFQVNGAADSAAILQTSADSTSIVFYDRVRVWGMYSQADCYARGFQFKDLAKGTRVVAEHLDGNLRITNSARAIFMISNHWEGGFTVEGTAEAVRDGFIGVQSRLASIISYGFLIKDNHSIVITDDYMESADRYLEVQGNGANFEGHVTVAGSKAQSVVQPVLNVVNYKGRIAGVSWQHYTGNPTARQINQTGTQPLNLLFMGNGTYGTTVVFNTTPTTTVMCIENAWTDIVPAGSMQVASDVLDDFRELGYYDILLNYTLDPVGVITTNKSTTNSFSGHYATQKIIMNGNPVFLPAGVDNIALYDVHGALVWTGDRKSFAKEFCGVRSAGLKKSNQTFVAKYKQ